jgi:hypothetical protein
MHFREDYEHTAVGTPPQRGTVSDDNKRGALAVSEDAAATGKRSLKFVDDAAFSQRFMPHLYWQPNHSNGVTKFAFSLRIEPGAIVSLDWRQWPAGGNYLTGPGLRVAAGKLRAGGRDLAVIPTGQWVRVEMESALGAAAARGWSLTLTLPGRAPQRFDGLKHGSANWRQLNWIGFSSEADVPAVWYLDDVWLEASPAP